MQLVRIAASVALSSTIALTPGSAFAEEAVKELKPLGAWHLDMAENKCRLARLFGDKDEETVFFLEQWDPSRYATWTVAGPPVEKFRASRKATIAFETDGDAGEFEFTGSKLGDYGNAVSARTPIVAYESPYENEEDWDYELHPRGMPALIESGAEKIERVRLSQKGRDDVVLALGPMKEPLEAINVCMSNLVEYWGFDVEQQKRVATPPVIKNMQGIVNRIVDYYPAGALRQGAQADFHLRLTVSETGAVEDCKLINQTLADEFDMRRHPCTIFKERAELDPAKTVEGVAVRTYFVTRILYRMGG